jgi:hypothetical protein
MPIYHIELPERKMSIYTRQLPSGKWAAKGPAGYFIANTEIMAFVRVFAMVIARRPVLVSAIKRNLEE